MPAYRPSSNASSETTERIPQKRLPSNKAEVARPETRPRLALIAHDGKKPEMVSFGLRHASTLRAFELVATGTTGLLLQRECGLTVQRVLSGPLGGDVQIASMVAQGDISAVFFLVDPLDKHPHDPDIQAMLRICNVHNIPLATNMATADIMLVALRRAESASLKAAASDRPAIG